MGEASARHMSKNGMAFNLKIDPKNKSIPAIFIERVEMQPNGIAFLYKDRGIYKGVCWKEYLKHVENFCLGL
ncbi:MAG: hypothetical protein SV375_21300, partial [Thermodesulfobacteriota bacterium]|nr:hypothetical protein [Thermodesulfobacteriota bacterium]